MTKGYSNGMEIRLIVCLHFTWENVLIQLEQTFDRPILDGRREHLASLANMAPTLKNSWEETTTTKQI